MRTETIPDRLCRLRKKMKERGIAVYVVPSTDCHESEYVCAHYRAREYLSGFTGSAGTLAVTLFAAGLWTDGRYFLQAEEQLKGTGIELFRMGEPGVPTVEAYVKEVLAEGDRLGFDGKVMGAAGAEAFLQAAQEKKAEVRITEDLAGEIWEDRPAIPDSELFLLENRCSGEGTKSKLQRVRRVMEEEGVHGHVLASLDDIGWLLNVRGGDIPCVPVVLSFLYLTMETCIWYVREQVVTDSIRRTLAENGVQIRAYERIYEDLERLPGGQKVLLNKKQVSIRLLTCFPEGVQLTDRSNPTEAMKAVKNETELSNLREAHRKEGLAFTRLMHWVKENAGRGTVTELLTADYLEQRRREQGNYLGHSFSPICAYGPHGAMVHYSATKESDVRLEGSGLFLVDAGGHYLEGTTDTTRTFVLGEISEEQKRMFTAVCRSSLHLAFAKFLYGCSGCQLDVLCREPLWQLAADYKHGTGHGVGYLLNVHEGPNAFRWKLPEKGAPAVLEAGMVTTDEPGIYAEGAYGIRTEHELVCKEGVRNTYGQFMEFEILTLTPIDLDGLLPQEMTGQEREWLNTYHARVYEELAPFMEEEEREWLREYTRRI